MSISKNSGLINGITNGYTFGLSNTSHKYEIRGVFVSVSNTARLLQSWIACCGDSGCSSCDWYSGNCSTYVSTKLMTMNLPTVSPLSTAVAPTATTTANDDVECRRYAQFADWRRGSVGVGVVGGDAVDAMETPLPLVDPDDYIDDKAEAPELVLRQRSALESAFDPPSAQEADEIEMIDRSEMRESHEETKRRWAQERQPTRTWRCCASWRRAKMRRLRRAARSRCRQTRGRSRR
jgi:hypothetical protein